MRIAGINNLNNTNYSLNTQRKSAFQNNINACDTVSFGQRKCGINTPFKTAVDELLSFFISDIDEDGDYIEELNKNKSIQDEIGDIDIFAQDIKKDVKQATREAKRYLKLGAKNDYRETVYYNDKKIVYGKEKDQTGKPLSLTVQKDNETNSVLKHYKFIKGLDEYSFEDFTDESIVKKYHIYKDGTIEYRSINIETLFEQQIEINKEGFHYLEGVPEGEGRKLKVDYQYNGKNSAYKEIDENNNVAEYYYAKKDNFWGQEA